MALLVITDRPTSSSLGTVATLGGGATTAHGATSDNNNATYVSVPARAVIDSQLVKLGFTGPTGIPAGAKILSVGIRRTVQTVLPAVKPPVCLHWHRCVLPVLTGAPLGSVPTPKRDPFQNLAPVADATAWFTEPLGDRQTTPDGEAWDLTTNLASFFYDFGRDDDESSLLLVAEVWRDITYQQQSTVTVTGPTGTISGTRATAQWTWASPDSKPQEAFQVAVYDQATTLVAGFAAFSTPPLQQSGWILGDDSQWEFTDDLVDGVYVVYVQARAQWDGPNDFPTEISSITFTRTATGVFPPNPLLTAVFDPDRNRVALTMMPLSSSPATLSYTVQASRDGGQSWQTRPLLASIPAAGMTPVVEYDRFFDVGVTMRYRVRSYATATPNASAAYSNTVPVQTYGDDWWIRHATNPLLDTKITPTPKGFKLIRDRVMGTHSVMSRNGKTRKVVNYGPVFADEGEIEFTFNAGEESASYWDAYDQLDEASEPLFVQQPTGTSQWWALGPGSSGQPTKVLPIPMAGNPSKFVQRKVTTGFTEVDPPAYY